MPILVEELSRKALSLSPEERVQLAEELLAIVQEIDAGVEAALGRRDQAPHCRDRQWHGQADPR